MSGRGCLIVQLAHLRERCDHPPHQVFGHFIGVASNEEMQRCVDLRQTEKRIQFIRQRVAWEELPWFKQLYTFFEDIELPPLTPMTSSAAGKSTVSTSNLTQSSDEPIGATPALFTPSATIHPMTAQTTLTSQSYITAPSTTVERIQPPNIATPTSALSTATSTSDAVSSTCGTTSQNLISPPDDDVHPSILRHLFAQLRPAGIKCGGKVWVRFLSGTSDGEKWQCFGLPTEEARTRFIRQKVAWNELTWIERLITQSFDQIELPPLTTDTSSSTTTTAPVTSSNKFITPISKSDASPPSVNFNTQSNTQLSPISISNFDSRSDLPPSAAAVSVQPHPSDESEDVKSKEEDEDENGEGDDLRQPLLSEEWPKPRHGFTSTD